MDPHKRTRKNDPIGAAQNAPPHHANEKGIQKKTQSKDDNKAKEEIDKLGKMKDGNEDEENQGSSEDEN